MVTAYRALVALRKRLIDLRFSGFFRRRQRRAIRKAITDIQLLMAVQFFELVIESVRNTGSCLLTDEGVCGLTTSELQALATVIDPPKLREIMNTHLISALHEGGVFEYIEEENHVKTTQHGGTDEIWPRDS